MQKRIMRLWLVLAVFAALFPWSAEARDAYRRLPWHLVDVHWQLDSLVEIEPFKELAIDVGVEGDAFTGPQYYIAPFGLFMLGDSQAYAGMQTSLRLDQAGSRGPGVIFSRFGERRLEMLRTATGGIYESAGYEGDFISVRNAMKWDEGRYTAKLSVVPDQQSPEGGRWVSFQLCEKQQSHCTPAGELAFPRKSANLKNNLYSFVEIYADLADEKQITPLTVTFSPPKLNGKPVMVMKATAIYPVDVPFVVRSQRTPDGGIRLTIGEKRDPMEVPVFKKARREQVWP